MQTSAGVRRDESLSRERRLVRRRDYLHVYETGRKLFSRYAVLFFAPNGLLHSRLGITATRKVGKANIRNRTKRWTKEVYRRERERAGFDTPAVDFVVNVKPAAATANFVDFNSDLKRLLIRATGRTSA